MRATGFAASLAAVGCLSLAGCSSSGGSSTTGGGATSSGGTSSAGSTGGGTTGGSTSGGTTGGGSTGGGTSSGGSTGGSCLKFTGQATQGPAAIAVVVDRSDLMAGSNWTATSTGIVTALDADTFDNQTLGLSAYPQKQVPPTTCLCNSALAGTCNPGDMACCMMYIMGVACGFATSPEVPLADAATAKSSASGVRHDIQQYLSSNSPMTTGDNGAPGYDTLSGVYLALQNAMPATRGVLLLAAAGFNCTSYASPMRPAYNDMYSCPDWEEPPTAGNLISGNYTGNQISTIVIGLPGSDTTGQMVNNLATAPYHMKLALNSYAVAGAPTAIDPSCSSGTQFTQNAGDPAAPCQLDLSSAPAFNAAALAHSIAIGRQKIMGCKFDLPVPPAGQTIDPAQVNVDLTVGGVKTTLLKRTSSSDMCTTDGCWDYSSSQVELIGHSCVALQAAPDGRVDIRVGCPTMTK